MNICVFGDSVAFGGSDIKNGGWAALLGEYVEEKGADKWNHVFNLGIPADTTEMVIKRLDMEARARRMTVCIFSIGVNDSQYTKKPNNTVIPSGKFEKNVTILIEKAQSLTNEIVFVGITKVDESKTQPIVWGRVESFYSNENIEKFNTIIMDKCKSKSVKFIDVAELLDVKNDLKDGIHPNTKGHKKMYGHIRDFLIKNEIIKTK